MNTQMREQIWAHFERWRNELPSFRIDAFSKLLDNGSIAIDPVDVPEVVQLLGRFAGKAGAEFFDPPIVIDFICRLLEGTGADTALDPAAGFGGLISAVQAKTGARRVVAIELASQAASLGKALNSIAEWHVGNSVQLLDSIESEFDVVVSSLPFGRTTESVELPDTTGGTLSLSGDISYQLLVLASLKLSAEGKGVFVVPASFFWSRRSPFRMLAQVGLGVEAALALPGGSFAPYHSVSAYITIVRRGRFDQVLVGQLSSDSHTNNQLIEKVRSGKEGTILDQGKYVLAFDFVGIDALRVAEQFAAAERRFGAPAIHLIELSSGEVFGRHEDGFRFPERDNAVYIPIVGESDVLVSIDGNKHRLHNYLQVAIDPSRSDATFVAQFFNSELGRSIRAAGKHGGIGARLTTVALKTLRLFVPPLETQKKMLEVDAQITAQQNTLAGLQNELQDRRRELWEDSRRFPGIQRSVLNLSERLERGLRQQAEEGLDNWREQLPFPLASILQAWDTVPQRDQKTKYEYLLHFFEASAEFLSIVCLSAYRNNAVLLDSLREELNRSLGEGRYSLRLASFGMWNCVLGFFSKQTRRLVNGTTDDRDLAKELYFDPQGALPAAISEKSILTVLESANTKRNRWLGHRGAVGEELAAQRHEELIAYLHEFRRATGVLWKNIELIEPVVCTNLGTEVVNDVQLLTGSNARFRRVERALLDCLIARELYLRAASSTRAIRLLPLVRLGTPPEERRDACYFFSRIDSEGVHFVSYHFAEAPDRVWVSHQAVQAIMLIEKGDALVGRNPQ